MNHLDAADAEARRAIVEDLGQTLVVEAAAGTGKTTELIRRILRVLTTGRAAMTGIVAVTFTEKAAGELKLRLREALEQERGVAGLDLAVRARLDEALRTLEEAHVNTIHGFCAELLRERPVEAAVDPLFAVLTEPQSLRLYAKAFDRWLQGTLQQPPDGVRRALRRTSAPTFGGGGDDGPVDRLRNAGYQLAQTRDYAAPWHRPPFDRAGEVGQCVTLLHRLADLCVSPISVRDNLFADLDAVRRLSGQIRLEQSSGYEDLDGWEARLVDLVRDKGLSRTRKGSGYQFSRTVTRIEVLNARDELFAALQLFKRNADADLAAALQVELRAATEAYDRLKAAAGALDFADLLTRARDLVRDNGEVRRYLQRRFESIFIDEFQDTDPVQAEILLLLSADSPDETDAARITTAPGKLFIVGDPKQAIYRFRGTDVATYWRVSQQIAERGGRIVQLTKSYRSVPEIQRFVNAAFAPEMTANAALLQPDYVPLSPDRASHPSQPAIVALPVPAPFSTRGYGRPTPSAWAIERSLPDAVAAYIDWLIDEKHGWTVAERQPDGTERRVALQPRHIAILFRRFVSFGEDVTRRYTDAIEARGIPHLLVGGKSFHGREEVETVRAALAAIEWPDDELSVFATLKGALFAIEDDALLDFRDRFGVLHPFRVPKALGGNSGVELELTDAPTTHLLPIAEALRTLQELHRRRNYRPVAHTISTLLEKTRAHVGFILRPAGEQVLANVLHVAEMARQYEASGGISFRGFIDELRAAAASEGAEAPILEESSDGVRIMTVHKAKGLEFPVVILADMTCRMSRSDASRYLDLERGLCAMKIGGWAPHELHVHEADEVARDQAEGVRLAYVAATRARDLLVVPAVGDEPWEGGWFSPLNRALYPDSGQRRNAVRGPKCPAFKSKDTVLDRPNGEVAGSSTVCPGLHEMPGGYSVVWWDPGSGGGLTLGAEAPFGVRRQDLIVKDVPRNVVADGRSDYDRWKLARADARAAGAAPSMTLVTVREWAVEQAEHPKAPDSPSPSERADPPEIAATDVVTIDLTTDAPADERTGGAAFGLLVHALLASAPLDASADELTDIAQREARLLEAAIEDVQAAASAAGRALAHRIGSRARAAFARGACRRETPVSVTLPDGRLVEGVVDLAFEEGGQWHVVDFKTDRELTAEGEQHYRRQVSLYAHAIARATGQPATGTILRL